MCSEDQLTRYLTWLNDLTLTSGSHIHKFVLVLVLRIVLTGKLSNSKQLLPKLTSSRRDLKWFGADFLHAMVPLHNCMGNTDDKCI